VKNRKWKW